MGWQQVPMLTDMVESQHVQIRRQAARGPFAFRPAWPRFEALRRLRGGMGNLLVSAGRRLQEEYGR